MELTMALAAGFLLDLAFGDPAWLPHPVVAMGRLIAGLEPALRRAFPKTKTGERAAGAVLVFLVLAAVLAVSVVGLWLAGRIHPGLRLALCCFWCAQCLAARGLWQESSRVQRCLEAGDLPAARLAVGRIVGRDTGALTEAGVTRAAVETVAENASDGVIAPLFWFAVAGAPGALLYKAVNTMDSMVGYKNDRYRYFGTAAARLDDAANFLPARLGALCMILAAAPAGLDAKGAFRVWRRDRRHHASPNSAQTESVCAGALQVQLAGDAVYFGKLVKKPFLGDALRPVCPQDIAAANRLMLLASGLFLLVCCAARWAVWTLVFG